LLEAALALEITYFCDARNQNIAGLPILSETIVVSGTHAESAVTPGNAAYVTIYATADTRWSYGAAPVATATAGAQGHLLPSGSGRDVPAQAGWKFSAITAG
jgi:hypothetical protein